MIVERPGLERRVLASLDEGRIPVVLGGGGTGRTSLLLRLERLIGRDHAQYLNICSAATTPERCLAAVRAVSRVPDDTPLTADTARDAFDGWIRHMSRPGADGTPVTWLLDDVLDIRTFESFPGLRHVQREFVAHMASSPSRVVLASTFTARMHRLLRDAPARFEVMHVPPLEAGEVRALAHVMDGARPSGAADVASAVAALTGGRAAYVVLMLDALATLGPAVDPVAAMAALCSPHGALTARCREYYEFRLQRARGYGALKAILGVLAEDEPLTLTAIALALHRTPGSTKDYLSWLEDVDLITARGKRYTFEDPVLRLYARLYGRPTPPSDDDVVREIGLYARARLPGVRERVVTAAAVEAGPDGGRASGIIEID